MHQGPGPGDSAWCSRGIQSRPSHLPQVFFETLLDALYCWLGYVPL